MWNFGLSSLLLLLLGLLGQVVHGIQTQVGNETQSFNSQGYDDQVTAVQDLINGVINDSLNEDLYRVLNIKDRCNGWQCREVNQPSSTELSLMVRQSFLKMSKAIHPDKNSHLPIVDADKAMIELNSAHKRLNDLESRKEYDRTPISTCLVGNSFCSFYSRFTQVKTSSQGSQTTSQSTPGEFSQVSAMYCVLLS
jgi:transcriptional regulator with PAS, ATPase and Fis domain